ncbi:hypothetical protein [Thioclava nitratireducens]|uniref:hypothetical protein n=1 Tax=Thioclava nitratireducens TaxID=1915078 RepID=UPI0012FD44A5|nr:hypothetical protein [Thioclava nitratireducens]
MHALFTGFRAMLRYLLQHYALASAEPETQDDFTASIARQRAVLEARNNGGLK